MGQVIATMSNATKSFDKQKVLDNINLELQSGKIVGIIGPSGAGKSTAIKCLMGMEKLDEGSVDIFHMKMPNREILKKIGYMGQSDALYGDLSGKENLVFFGSLMGLAGTALDRAIEKNMQLVDLLNFLDKPVKTYSGGMKRRLSLAITLLSNPDLLILDEPTVGIDPSLRVTIWAQLKELANNNKGIIVTTHVMDEAEKCDYVGLIIEGKLFAFGSPQELKDQFKATSIEDVFLKAEVNVK